MGRTVYSVVTTERVVEKVKEVTKEVIVPIYQEAEGLNPDEQSVLNKYRRISPDQRKSYQNQLDLSVASKAAKKYRKARGIT